MTSKTLPKGLSFYKLWQSQPGSPSSQPAAKPEPKLTRVAFKVSRLMEFCSERELENQTGHSVWEWPLGRGQGADRQRARRLRGGRGRARHHGHRRDGHDRCSGQRAAASTPRPSNRCSIIRSGSRPARPMSRRPEARRATPQDHPGHGLRARPQHSDGAGRRRDDHRERSGVKHRIEFRVDHIDHQPKIVRTASASPVMVGTKITVKWPPTRAPLFGHAADQIHSSSSGPTSWFNPHLTLRGTWFGQEFVNVAATNPHWEKWRPRNPTSPHWYDEARLQRYLAAHVSRDRDLGQRRTVREFIAEFRGLSGTARSTQNPRRGRLLAPIAGDLLRRRTGQQRRRRQASCGDEDVFRSRSRRSCSASSARST